MFQDGWVVIPIGVLGKLRIHWTSFLVIAIVFCGLWPFFKLYSNLSTEMAVVVAALAAVMIIVSVILHEMSHTLSGFLLGIDARRSTTNVIVVFGWALEGSLIEWSRWKRVFVHGSSIMVHAALTVTISLALIDTVRESAWFPALVVIAWFNLICLINNAVPDKNWRNDGSETLAAIFAIQEHTKPAKQIFVRLWTVKPTIILCFALASLFLGWWVLAVVSVGAVVYFFKPPQGLSRIPDNLRYKQ